MNRTVDVRPRSAREEGANVLRFSLLVVAVAAGVIWTHRQDAARNDTAGRFAWQRTFRDLGPADQRTYNALKEALTEAENIRSENLVWSSTTALASRGVPPFALDPIDGDVYRWTFARQKNVVNYLGTARRGSGRNAFLLLIVEPTEEEASEAPATLEEAPTPDELNHVLSDGTLIHVSIWTKATEAAIDRLIAAPEREGWTQIIVGGRS
jgi:hypothetical protein